MQLVNTYAGHENATNVVVEHDQKLLLPLLLEAYKLLMFLKVEEFQDFGFAMDFQNLL
jgi:hypothetical protein